MKFIILGEKRSISILDAKNLSRCHFVSSLGYNIFPNKDSANENKAIIITMG